MSGFRVRVWKSLGHQPEQFNFILNGLNEGYIPDMSALKVNVRTWDPMANYISVQVGHFEISTINNRATAIFGKLLKIMYSDFSINRSRL